MEEFRWCNQMTEQEFISRKVHLEEEIREIDDMEARGEDITEQPFYSRDLVLHDKKGDFLTNKEERSLKSQLKKHLQ